MNFAKAAIGLGVIIGVIAAFQGSSSSSSAASCTPGDLRWIKAGTPALARTKAAFDAMINAAVAHDTVGMRQLYFSGRFFDVPVGTRVRVLSIDFAHVEVRVLRGSDPVAWADCSWLRS